MAAITATGSIVFEQVSKRFGLHHSSLARLLDAWSGRNAPREHVEVLSDISFSVPPGQLLGVIGINGSGKSTMLHLAGGLLSPSAGNVTVTGRVASLLDLGGSFLADLTGRENATFYHRLISRSDDDRVARERAVEEFASLGESFDRPVRTYSSGMFLRLAFACAICERPDVLLIDEVLAVGDARFQQKCYQRIRELRDGGTTIMLVTHVLTGLPALCDRVLLLDRGRLVFDGDPGVGLERYAERCFGRPDMRPSQDTPGRFGHGGAVILDAFASRDGVQPRTSFQAGESVRISALVAFEDAIDEPQFGIACATKEGVRIYATSSGMLGVTTSKAASGEQRTVSIDLRLDVAVTDLFIDLSVFEIRDGEMIVMDVRFNTLHLTIEPPSHFVGLSDLSATIRLVP